MKGFLPVNSCSVGTDVHFLSKQNLRIYIMLYFSPDDSWSCGQNNMNYLSRQPKDLPVVDYLQNSLLQLHQLWHMCHSYHQGWGNGSLSPFLETGLASWHSLTETMQPKWHYVISGPAPKEIQLIFLLPSWEPAAMWRSYITEWWQTMKRQRQSTSPLLFHPPYLKWEWGHLGSSISS